MPRLIDADKLIGDLHNHAFLDGDDREITYNVIQKQPTVGGWISVKDRLPPNADHPGAFCPRYLVCTDFGITVGWYNPDKGKWYGCGWWMYDTNRVADVDFERGDIPKRVVLPVEAWMPFPELPEEVKQDG